MKADRKVEAQVATLDPFIAVMDFGLMRILNI